MTKTKKVVSSSTKRITAERTSEEMWSRLMPHVAREDRMSVYVHQTKNGGKVAIFTYLEQ